MNSGKKSEKGRRYLTLIEDAKQDYALYPAKHANKRVQLVWRDDCKEINLYTYWQGLDYANKTPKIKILVFAQDFGGATGDCNASKINKQLAHNESPIQYLDGFDISAKDMGTDGALTVLFDSIGYANIDKRRYDDLFFTNFALGYRQGTGSISGGMNSAVMAADAEFAKRLIDILEPEIILCLGRHTYEAAVRAYGEKPLKGSYNDIIEKSVAQPFVITSSTGKKSKLYPVAHCGTMGTMNRNRGLPKTYSRSLERQIKDWKAIFS